jgi:hypothetical protein
MPTILETIHDYELDLLVMIAEKWGCENESLVSENPADKIAGKMQVKASACETLDTLPQAEQEAVADLYRQGGKTRWDQFTRKYGFVREMGAIPRERERPDRNPTSITEHLFYIGMIGRAFFKDQNGLEEYAYLPDEFKKAFEFPDLKGKEPINISVFPSELINAKKWSDGVINHAATLLAEMRKSKALPDRFIKNPYIPVSFLENLLIDAGIIRKGGKLESSRVGEFLKYSKPQALRFLFEIWRDSKRINELSLVKNLQAEVGWKNKPVRTRAALLSFIEKLPLEKWVRLQDFITWIHCNHPDFLRTAGEYDSWLIKNITDGAYLQGFGNWPNVEGALLSTWFIGPAVWMGLVEIGTPYGDTDEIYIHQSKHAVYLLNRDLPDYKVSIKQNFTVEKSGRLIISRFFPQDARYQIARFCELVQADAKKYIYQITPDSLAGLKDQDLKPAQLITLLKKFGKKPVPENFINAIRRWEKNEIEAKIEKIYIVKVKSPDILQQLMKSSAAPYIIEQLNETTVKVKEEGILFIQAALIKSGILSVLDTDL